MFPQSLAIILSFLCFAHAADAASNQLVTSPTKNRTEIVYPEDTNGFRSKANRPVVANPKSCNEGELFYPGDNRGDWVCDCKPGFVFYPTTGLCYEANTQGPCTHDEIIQITNNSKIPQCLRNRCPIGKVYFKENCFPLNDPKGCEEYFKLLGRRVFLVTNPKNFELMCTDINYNYECFGECCYGNKEIDFRNICIRLGIVTNPSEDVTAWTTTAKQQYSTTPQTTATSKYTTRAPLTRATTTSGYTTRAPLTRATATTSEYTTRASLPRAAEITTLKYTTRAPLTRPTTTTTTRYTTAGADSISISRGVGGTRAVYTSTTARGVDPNVIRLSTRVSIIRHNQQMKANQAHQNDPKSANIIQALDIK